MARRPMIRQQQTTTAEDDAWLTGKTQTRAVPAWASGELTVELIAAALCEHAQRHGYDHGESPTIANWNTEYPACPRHLSMAAKLSGGNRDGA